MKFKSYILLIDNAHPDFGAARHLFSNVFLMKLSKPGGNFNSV